jgi:enoyl-[acyl-carrier protein] reductase/trans-2-enoyl-CoA reductase (NAD+)
MDLGRESMAIFRPDWDGADLHLDGAYKEALPEFHERKARLTSADLPGAFARLYEPAIS